MAQGVIAGAGEPLVRGAAFRFQPNVLPVLPTDSNVRLTESDKNLYQTRNKPLHTRHRIIYKTPLRSCTPRTQNFVVKRRQVIVRSCLLGLSGVAAHVLLTNHFSAAAMAPDRDTNGRTYIWFWNHIVDNQSNVYKARF